MSNSSLVNYTKISPNRTSPRNHKIDTITIHCVVGQCTVETLGNIFAPTSRQASSNYGIGYDGRIGMYCEEKDRSWCTSSASNDNRAVTIEVASDTKEPYAVTDKAYKALIKLVADICKRNGIKKLLWQGDKSLIGNVAKQNMTVHRWFANKSCPGTYLYNLHPQIAKEVNALLGSKEEAKKTVKCTGYAEQFYSGYAGTYTTTEDLNLRHGGGTKYGIMTTMPKGAKVKCYGYFTKNGSAYWLNVVYVDGNTTYEGFCNKKYLK